MPNLTKKAIRKNGLEALIDLSEASLKGFRGYLLRAHKQTKNLTLYIRFIY